MKGNEKGKMRRRRRHRNPSSQEEGLEKMPKRMAHHPLRLRRFQGNEHKLNP